MHTFYTGVEFFLAGLKAPSDGVGRILLGDNMEAEVSCCGQSGSFVIYWTGLSCVCIY
jgi:anti-sigma factor ChrR (cupin superfamily)